MIKRCNYIKYGDKRDVINIKGAIKKGGDDAAVFRRLMCTLADI